MSTPIPPTTLKLPTQITLPPQAQAIRLSIVSIQPDLGPLWAAARLGVSIVLIRPICSLRAPEQHRTSCRLDRLDSRSTGIGTMEYRG